MRSLIIHRDKLKHSLINRVVVPISLTDVNTTVKLFKSTLISILQWHLCGEYNALIAAPATPRREGQPSISLKGYE